MSENEKGNNLYIEVDAKATERRFCRVLIANHMLFDMLTKGWVIGDGSIIRCVEGIPQGAKFINSYFDVERDCACLVFEHQSFPNTPPWEILPIQPVTFNIEYQDLTKFTLINDDATTSN